MFIRVFENDSLSNCTTFEKYFIFSYLDTGFDDKYHLKGHTHKYPGWRNWQRARLLTGRL